MKQCPNCRNQIPDDSVFCPVCGTSINTYQAPINSNNPNSSNSSNNSYTPPKYTPPVYIPPVKPHDHSKTFRAEDISKNKLYCMFCYLFSVVGIIIALLGAKDSEYAQFHIRQAMKFAIVEVLLSFAIAVLCWTLIVPIVGGIAMAGLFILKIIAFVDVCNGKAVEPAVIRSLNFLN